MVCRGAGIQGTAGRAGITGTSDRPPSWGKKGAGPLVATVSTVAYLGLEARTVEVQCQLVPGLPAFIVVGLPDKAVAESRERVRNAIAAIGLSLPPKRITVC